MVLRLLVAGTITLAAYGSPPDRASSPAPQSTAPRSHSKKSDLALQQCMADLGWKIEVQPNGGFKATFPPDQQNSYLGDQDACVKQFEADHRAPTVTAADYRALYKQELATMACLEKAGFPATGQPVSEQQYVDAYSAGRSPSWYAYLAVANVSGDEFAKVEEQCPQPRLDK